MKKKILSLSLASLVLLSACSWGQEGAKESSTSSSKEVKQEQSSQSSSSSSSQSEESKDLSSSDGDLAYNGSYYSVKDSQGKDILVVNKRYPLAADYNPGEDPEAKSAFLELQAAMRQAGYSVSDSYSGFRDYATQSQLYSDYVARDGQAAADRYSARPGHSEHQSGLAFDLIDGSGNLLQESKAASWLLQHASDYGFIVRYPAGKESVTGYQHEEWHLRYIGHDAPAIAASGKTLEEYYGFAGGDYKN